MESVRKNRLSLLVVSSLLLINGSIRSSEDAWYDSQLFLAGVGFVSTLVSAIIMTKIMRSDLFSDSAKSFYEDWTKKPIVKDTLMLTEEQSDVLWKTVGYMKSHTNPHAVIVGNAGSGKTTIARVLAKKLSEKDPMFDSTPFEGAVLWRVDADAINSSGLVGQVGKRLKLVWNDAKNYYEKTGSPVILFFDEFHRLLGLGSSSLGNHSSITEILKTLTGNEADYCGIHILGATTTSEYRTYVLRDGAIARRFPAYTLPPVASKSHKELLKRKCLDYQCLHGIITRSEEIDSVVDESMAWFDCNLELEKRALEQIYIQKDIETRRADQERINSIHCKIAEARRSSNMLLQRQYKKELYDLRKKRAASRKLVRDYLKCICEKETIERKKAAGVVWIESILTKEKDPDKAISDLGSKAEKLLDKLNSISNDLCLHFSEAQERLAWIGID